MCRPGLIQERISVVSSRPNISVRCSNSRDAAQAEEGNAQNLLASTDSSEPAAMGRHRSGRIEERLSFVSGRGSWHPTSTPDTNGRHILLLLLLEQCQELHKLSVGDSLGKSGEHVCIMSRGLK